MTKTSNTATGTCQICERSCKLPRGLASLHGYRRPGDGETHGRCPGAGHVAWEVGCDALVAYVADLTSRRDHTIETLAAARELLANGTEVTEHVVRRFPARSELVTYKRGERSTDPRTLGYDMFGIVASNRVRANEMRLDSIERELARQSARLAGWSVQS